MYSLDFLSQLLRSMISYSRIQPSWMLSFVFLLLLMILTNIGCCYAFDNVLRMFENMKVFSPL